MLIPSPQSYFLTACPSRNEEQPLLFAALYSFREKMIKSDFNSPCLSRPSPLSAATFTGEHSFFFFSIRVSNILWANAKEPALSECEGFLRRSAERISYKRSTTILWISSPLLYWYVNN